MLTGQRLTNINALLKNKYTSKGTWKRLLFFSPTESFQVLCMQHQVLKQQLAQDASKMPDPQVEYCLPG